MGQLNEQEIIKLYTQDLWTLRMVADSVNSNHHTIRRILQKHNIAISAKQRRKPFSEDHKKRISESRKKLKANGWIPHNLGIKMSESANRKNMATKLNRLLVTGEVLSKYKNFDKLKFLTRGVSRHRKEFQSDEKFISYLDKFYFCKEFNKQYDRWIESGKNKWYMPSIDHINPKANGGICDLNNLRFITWFENRAKADMPIDEWNEFKRITNTNSELFV